jgi:SAM-dependent methyltransferase
VLTPARRRGVEILDDPNVDPAVRERSIGDVTRSNSRLGGLRAARLALRQAMAAFATYSVGDANAQPTTLLDVGTGLGDIPAAAASDARARNRDVVTIGVDEAFSLLVAARSRLTHVVCANALALPFRDHSIDVVSCSQVLHHFEDVDALRLLEEMDRVAMRAVVISDLRRSWLAVIGFWFVSWPLRFHRVTRHDGIVSVLRGFTDSDLHRLVARATGNNPSVRRRLGYRLTALWTPRATKDAGEET